MDTGLSSTSWQSKLVARMGRKMRSDKHYTNEAAEKRTQREKGKLRKRSHPLQQANRQEDINELGERKYSVFSDASTLVEPTVIARDHTDMFHLLSMTDDYEYKQVDKRKTALNLVFDLEQLQHFEKHALLVEQIPDETWQYIAALLDPTSAAFLALANKSLYRKTAYESMWRVNQQRDHRNRVLHHFDRAFRDHLLCFHCSQYHRRIQPGREMLKINHVVNPVVMCPRLKSSVLPRIRLTHGRELPYAYVQLAMRHYLHSKGHGISHDSLERHWKCKDSAWSHRTRYMPVNGRLAVRIRSQCFAAPDLTETAQRHLLYDREEYTPFFSVCPHWRDGVLMDVCKCMLSHVPRPPKSYMEQLKQAPTVSRAATKANFIISGCEFCRPARRCTDCPSEYLVEIQMVEDSSDPVHKFKHAIVVTRWADLGDGSSPFTSPEWVAISGGKTTDEESYDSFTNVGRRAIAGSFESAISGTMPGQRLVSLNPKREKRGENEHGWY